MYFRGILNFALHGFYDAITDFETVIEKSEETNAKYYLARGRCHACLSMFKEAITDLSIAINLNKDLLDVSLICILGCIGLFEPREMCLSDRRHWLGLHGLPEADSSGAEEPDGAHLRRQSSDDHRFV